jgi:hypothetical protein
MQYLKDGMGWVGYQIAKRLVFQSGCEVLPEVDLEKGFFGLEAKDIDGNLLKFSDLKGKWKGFLIVNVATQ